MTPVSNGKSSQGCAVCLVLRVANKNSFVTCLHCLFSLANPRGRVSLHIRYSPLRYFLFVCFRCWQSDTAPFVEIYTEVWLLESNLWAFTPCKVELQGFVLRLLLFQTELLFIFCIVVVYVFMCVGKRERERYRWACGVMAVSCRARRGRL